jgi:hypothetical protein
MSSIAQAVVDRLKEQLPAYVVDHFPDAPERYPFTAAKETLLVSYESSSYGPADSLAPLSVERTGTVGITLLTRSLHGDLGVIASVDGIIKALFGWRPAKLVAGVWVPLGASPMVPTRDAFVAEDNGVWRWSVEFSLRTTVVATITPLSGPPLATITLIPS